MDDHLYPLGDVVRALRSELVDAIERGADQDLRFRLGSVELEFTVVARREAGGGGVIKFSVLGIGAEGGANAKVAQEQTQKVKLQLTPVLRDADGAELEVEVSRRPAAADDDSAALTRSPGHAAPAR